MKCGLIFQKIFNMPKKVLEIIIIFLSFMVIIIACQKDFSEEVVFENANINLAKLWYESNFSTEMSLISDKFTKGKIFKAKPKWNLAFNNNGKNSDVVEIPIEINGELGITSDDNYKEFQKSNNKTLIQSETRLIIELGKNETFGFLMTIVPEILDNNVTTLQYKKWKSFSGAILYHRLDGSFSNGLENCQWKSFGCD